MDDLVREIIESEDYRTLGIDGKVELAHLLIDWLSSDADEESETGDATRVVEFLRIVQADILSDILSSEV